MINGRLTLRRWFSPAVWLAVAGILLLVFFAPVASRSVRDTWEEARGLSPEAWAVWTIGLGVAATVLGLLLVYPFRRRILRPIRVLADRAKVISDKCDSSVPAPEIKSEPARELIGEFNRMLDKIQAQTVALEEGRARLEGIIASAMDAIISLDEQQRITLFNQAAEVMFRCPASEALGTSINRFIPEQFREAHRHHVQQFGQDGSTSRAMGHLRPLSAVRADGEEFPIEASISQVNVGGNKVYTVILRDITERKRWEEQLARMNAELEERVEKRTAELMSANRELEAFTYSVAHDLRAPLRHIDAYAGILLEDFSDSLPGEAREHLHQIARGSRNMSRLVEDLLNLARVGRQEIKFQAVRLDRPLDSALAEFRQELEARAVDLRIGPLPWANCDPGLMKQVFTNLLSNALKYTRPRPRPVIEVGVDREGVVFMRDNGVGFDMKYAHKLFGVFQRLHRPEEFEGTGVGLATVERIIRRHGGSVWAHGSPNDGATFYFKLPEVLASEQPAKAA